MGINWKVRLRHPAFYTALAGVIGFILTDMGVIDVGKYETYVSLIFALSVSAGAIVDLTTDGVADSKQALTYDKPKKDGGTDGRKDFY